MSKLSRIVLIVLAGVLVFPATASAESGCRKHRDSHSHKWVTHCARGAAPAAVPPEAADAPPPPPGQIVGPTNTDPTNRYWWDPED